VSQIPDDLLTMDNATYGSFVLSKARIQDALETWLAQRTANAGLHTVQFHTSQDPLALIRNALAQCPDESPAPSTTALAFVSDTDLRTNLRNDIGAIYRALSNGEWKATTILAGSAIEALLLWDLQNRPPSEVSAALTKLSTKSVFDKKVPTNLEDWALHHYIEVSAEIGRIVSGTAIEARLTKNFRNLIHPGKSQRLGQKCDRGTAYASVAALEHVVRDLTP
jgi:hypothetical protein